MKAKLPLILLSTLILLSVTLNAQEKKTIKSVDIKIETPKAGSLLQDARNVALLEVRTEFGDLFKTGEIFLQHIAWDGEFEYGADRHPRFKDGFTYTAIMRIGLKQPSAYQTNYITTADDIYIDDSRLKVTVNGVQGNVMISSPTYPQIRVRLKVGGDNGAVAAKSTAEIMAKSEYFKNKAKYRAMYNTPYTQDEADALWIGRNEHDVVILNRSNKPAEGYGGIEFLPWQKACPFNGQTILYVTKVILDISDSDCRANCKTSDFAGNFTETFNLKELWLSDKVDAAAFVTTLNKTMISKLWPWWRTYWDNSPNIYTSKATLVVHESAAPQLRAILADDPLQPCYVVRTYSGDIYAAQKAGLKATKTLCRQHDFSARIMATDRIYRHATCQANAQWYYSCSICGECEYNSKHTFNRDYKENSPAGKRSHNCFASLATDEAYIGVNAAGEHVYWESCPYCGHSHRYLQQHLTKEEFRLIGMDCTFEQYIQITNSTLKAHESQVLVYTEAQPDTFTLPLRSEAKMSKFAQDGVNRALNDNLIDLELLGADYTLPLTRLQLSSIAVRLTEELTGKAVSTGRRFSDTDNLYARKAAAIGLTKDIVGETFFPDAIVSRQELAAFIYRALGYVEKNSAYSYTAYDSRLASYPDHGSIKTWAREAMAFMNALGLIEDTSAGTLAPEAACSIEKALVTAEKSVYAHQIGWYQALAVGEKSIMGTSDFHAYGGGNDRYWYVPSSSAGTTGTSLPNSERIWVTGPRWGHNGQYLPVRSPYTGQQFFIEAEWYRPVR